MVLAPHSAGLGGGGSRQERAVPVAISEKSIAVLPFENLSLDPANEFFADGVHEDVLTNLSYIRDLTVVPRIIATRYRATKLRPRDLGAELRVAYLVTGTVRRVGTTVRVTGELIHAQTEQGRWNRQRDYEGTDVMAGEPERAGNRKGRNRKGSGRNLQHNLADP